MPSEPPELNVSTADYAPPAPAWSGLVSSAVGGMSLLWICLGIFWAFFTLGEGGGAALKAVLLAAGPSALVGLLLGLAALNRRARLGTTGVTLNGTCLLCVVVTLGYVYARNVFG